VPDLERTRVRQREPSPPDPYEEVLKYLTELRDRAFKNKVVIDGDEQAWWQTRQGRCKVYLSREADTGSCLRDWQVFIHDIRTHSGKHRHQGGTVIFVIEGEGYTEVEGERIEWEAGDVLLLPFREGGVEHKHYNKRPGESCKWMAFLYRPYGDEVGNYLEQKENSPEFR
jgi:mannose-6-phosphate isomerase-like protein (cupin superfamily)